jgi:hypothetical protein
MRMPRPPKPRSGFCNACWSAMTMSSAETASRTCTRQRDNNAEFNSNEGFSVVAPTKIMLPRSMCGRNASCCTLLNRCTSSTNSTVRRPPSNRRCASASTSRTCGKPLSTAEIATNSASAYRASNKARVVLPQPGGPHKIIEWTCPPSMARRSAAPCVSKRFCPTMSSSIRGRMRSASGRNRSGSSPGIRSCCGGSTVTSLFANELNDHSAASLRCSAPRDRSWRCARLQREATIGFDGTRLNS